MKPIFCGKGELDQLNIYFKHLGTPNNRIWPGYNDFPLVKKIKFDDHPYNNLNKLLSDLPKQGFDLANRLLTYCPEKRITAERALSHPFFTENPLPIGLLLLFNLNILFMNIY